MSKFLDYIKIAFANIKMNKVRSALTMLGLVIGISSVVLTISTGNGFRDSIYNTLNDMVGNSIYLLAADENHYITEADIKAIEEKVNHVKGITMDITTWVEVESESRFAPSEVSARFGTPDLQYLYSEPLVRGRYFTWEEYDNYEPVCVVPESTAKAFFGSADVLGETLEIELYGGYYNLKIVGVREDSESAATQMLYGTGKYTIEVPHSLINERLGAYGIGMEHFMVYILADSQENVAQVANDSVNLVTARHDVRGEGKFEVLRFDSVLEGFSAILNVITVFIVMIAMISLLVGGIGIMNIMLVSVTERTKEIGIRKALGARTGSILFQFLVEAGTISLLGGVIGILVGIGGATLICSLAGSLAQMPIVADYNPFFILAVALFSSGIGVFFGLYPARKAAKLTPIEALRRK